MKWFYELKGHCNRITIQFDKMILQTNVTQIELSVVTIEDNFNTLRKSVFFVLLINFKLQVPVLSFSYKQEDTADKRALSL